MAKLTPMPTPEAENELRGNIRHLLASMIESGAAAFEMHADGLVVLESPSGERALAEPPTGTGVDHEKLDTIIRRLKELAGILYPTPWFHQEGQFKTKLDVGGVTETVGIWLTTVPAQPQVGNESMETHEVVRIEMKIVPWLMSWWRVVLPASVALVPLGIWLNPGGILSMVVCIVCDLGLLASYPRAYADRKVARQQELVVMATLLLAPLGIGGVLRHLYDVVRDNPADDWWLFLGVCALSLLTGQLSRWWKQRHKQEGEL